MIDVAVHNDADLGVMMTMLMVMTQKSGGVGDVIAKIVTVSHSVQKKWK